MIWIMSGNLKLPACRTSVNNSKNSECSRCTQRLQIPHHEMLFHHSYRAQEYRSATGGILRTQRNRQARTRGQLPHCRTQHQVVTDFPVHQHGETRTRTLKALIPLPFLEAVITRLRFPPAPTVKRYQPRLSHHCRRRHLRYVHRGLGSQ